MPSYSSPITPAKPQSATTSSMLSETPLKQNMSSTNVFVNGTLEQQKKAIRTDLGPIPEVSVEFMLQHIIPRSKVDVGATHRVLQKRKAWTDKTGWQKFENRSPKEHGNMKGNGNKNKETEVFLRLKEVYKDIISATQFADSTPRDVTLLFDQKPNNAPVSDKPVKTRPDCCAILTPNQAIHSAKEHDPSNDDGDDNDEAEYQETSKRRPSHSPKVNWFDIAYVEEYKLDDRIEDLNDNIYKILWSLHYIMHTDHRRRFTYGLTIENETARIWFCCRQIVLVSEPFNFNKDARQLVQLVASLAYATPTQLGYDPTMTLRWRHRGWHYDIELTTILPDGRKLTQLYETFYVISNTAYNIRGRATRVYKARTRMPEDASSETEVVLKDSWIDVGRAKEGDTLAELLGGASDDHRKYFLTVLQHGIVQIDGQDDSTQDLILNGQIITIPDGRPRTFHNLNHFAEEFRKQKGMDVGHEQHQQEPTTSTNEARLFPLYHHRVTPGAPSSRSKSQTLPSPQNTTSDGLLHQSYEIEIKPIVYSPKHHYRIVFKEVGESLLSMASSGRARIPNVDQALRDITLALKFVAKRGYVHRDVSAGNILICEGEHARLADLEFAKAYGTGATSYVRTGTYSFMAGEVARGEYTLNPKFKPFAHNPIHDLESLWWVGVWCMMWHYPVPDDNAVDSSKQPHIDSMKEYGRELFPSHHSSSDKTRINEIHGDHYSRRGPNEYPPDVAFFLIRLDGIRGCIASAYKEIQEQLPRTEASYFTDILRIPVTDTRMSVHDAIIDMLDTALDAYPVPDTLLWPLDLIHEHAEWIKNKNNRRKLRPRAAGRDCINMDEHQNYFET